MHKFKPFVIQTADEPLSLQSHVYSMECFNKIITQFESGPDIFVTTFNTDHCVNLENVVARVDKLYTVGNDLVAEIEKLDTPKAQILMGVNDEQLVVTLACISMVLPGNIIDAKTLKLIRLNVSIK